MSKILVLSKSEMSSLNSLETMIDDINYGDSIILNTRNVHDIKLCP